MNDSAEPTDPPSPIRVVMMDLDGPLPELQSGGRYGSAMLIGLRHGVPESLTEIDLHQDEESILAETEAFRRRSRAAGSRAPIDPADDKLPTITVVVPTMVTRVEELTRLLDTLQELDYPRVDFIVVDNRPQIPLNDQLTTLVAGRPGVQVVRQTRPGTAAARNAGLKHATGQIVAFTDDDVRVDQGWLRAIARRFFADPGLDGLMGLVLPVELETPAQIWFERYYGGFGAERSFSPLTFEAERSGLRALRGSRIVATTDDGTVVRRFPVYGIGAYGAGANMAFRRSSINRVGGFDVALGPGTLGQGGEDLPPLISVLWSGGRLAYEPACFVYHQHRRDVADLKVQLHRNGSGYTAMLTSLIAHDPRHLLGLASQLPRAVPDKFKQAVSRIRTGRTGAETASTDPTPDLYPRDIAVQEWRGLPIGPFVYVKSRRFVRGWTPQRDAHLR